MAAVGEEALRVKLDALGRRGLAADAHQLILVDRPGGFFEVLVQLVGVDDQTVVSRRGERVIQPGEDRLAVVMDLAGLAVH